MRLAPNTNVGPRLLDFSASDDTKRMALGTILEATSTDYDTTANVANWGQAELIYVSSVQSAAILPGTLLVQDKNFRVAPSAAAASQINTGQPVLVALTHFSAGNTTEQYGWALRRGVAPVRFSVAATVGRVFAGTAGMATPTQANGAQILNAQTLIAATSTFTRTVTTRSGSSRVAVSNVAGMYPGQAIAGTGIPSSSVISSVDPSGQAIVIGSAVGTPVAATATGAVTATMTNTGYGIVQLDYPFYQGQVA